MSKLRYAYQGEKEGIVRAMARGIHVSPKEAYEIANAVRGMKLGKARIYLQSVIDKKAAIPYNRFNKSIPHRTKLGPGRYPLNTSKGFLKLINEAEANAEVKGMNTENLVIKHIATHRGEVIQGRFKGSRHNTPTTHIEIVVSEELEKKDNHQAKQSKRESEK